jgi:opacity protein-like surface antigen
VADLRDRWFCGRKPVSSRLPITGDDQALRIRAGWVAGAGEVAIAPDWSVRLEYLYDNFGKTAVPCRPVRARIRFRYPHVAGGIELALGANRG